MGHIFPCDQRDGGDELYDLKCHLIYFLSLETDVRHSPCTHVVLKQPTISVRRKCRNYFYYIFLREQFQLFDSTHQNNSRDLNKMRFL